MTGEFAGEMILGLPMHRPPPVAPDLFRDDTEYGAIQTEIIPLQSNKKTAARKKPGAAACSITRLKFRICAG